MLHVHLVLAVGLVHIIVIAGPRLLGKLLSGTLLFAVKKSGEGGEHCALWLWRGKIGLRHLIRTLGGAGSEGDLAACGSLAPESRSPVAGTRRPCHLDLDADPSLELSEIHFRARCECWTIGMSSGTSSCLGGMCQGRGAPGCDQ